jgi:hypothetical protein
MLAIKNGVVVETVERSHISFAVTIGALYRGLWRSAFEDLKRDLKFNYPRSVVDVQEQKGWLDSRFWVDVKNVPQEVVQIINRKLDGYKFGNKVVRITGV